MPPSDESPRSISEPGPAAPDWLGWAALAWAVAFGLLYAHMIVATRFPTIAAILRRHLPGGS